MHNLYPGLQLTISHVKGKVDLSVTLITGTTRLPTAAKQNTDNHLQVPLIIPEQSCSLSRHLNETAQGEFVKRSLIFHTGIRYYKLLLKWISCGLHDQKLCHHVLFVALVNRRRQMGGKWEESRRKSEQWGKERNVKIQKCIFGNGFVIDGGNQSSFQMPPSRLGEDNIHCCQARLEDSDISPVFESCCVPKTCVTKDYIAIEFTFLLQLSLA